MKISGRLTCSDTQVRFNGCVVRATYSEAIAVDATDAKTVVSRPRNVSTTVEPGGSFMIELLAGKGPVELTVFAPTGEILATHNVPSDNGEEHTIAVGLRPPYTLSPQDQPEPGRRGTLTGLVLDSAGACKAGRHQVVLWARSVGAEPGKLVAVLTAETDAAGYFFGPRPVGKFAEAYGTVLDVSSQKVPIVLAGDQFPPRVILVIDLHCQHEPPLCPGRTGETPRGPDHEQLVTDAETYSTDLGGGRCVDMTAPNRTLEEFSFYTVVRITEPALKEAELSRPQGLAPPVQRLCSLLLTPATKDAAQDVTRGARSVRATRATAATVLVEGAQPNDSVLQPALMDTEVLRDIMDDPEGVTSESLNKAARLSLQKQLNALIDLSLGYTGQRLALDTQHPIDWERPALRRQAVSLALGHLLHFKQVWKADGYSLGDLLHSLPLAPCQKKQVAIVDWSRREQSARAEATVESEELAATISRERDINEIVNTSLTEKLRGGSWALTGGYGEGGGLAGLVGGVMAVFGYSAGIGGATSQAWENASRDLAASSLQTLRDRTLQAASAVRSQRSTVVQTVEQGETVKVETEVVANHNHCHAITMEYFEVLRHFQVSHELADVRECLFVPLTMSRFDMLKALRWREPLELFLRKRALLPGFAALDRINREYAGSDLPAESYAADTLRALSGEATLTMRIPRPADNDDLTFKAVAWSPLGWIFDAAGQGIFNLHIKDSTNRDKAFQDYVAPQIAEAFVSALSMKLGTADGSTYDVGLDATLVSDYKANAPLTISLNCKSIPAIPRDSITSVTLIAPTTADSSAADQLPADAKIIVRALSLRYRTDHIEHALCNNARPQEHLLLNGSVSVNVWLDPEEKRNPHDEDSEKSAQLLAHLNEHIEYYHKVLWTQMDANRRFMLLDGYRIDFPWLPLAARNRSIASVIENRLIGIVGNSLVFPVAHGVHLDPSFSTRADQPVDLRDHYASDQPPAPMRISVPTPGVYAEAVLGACNSCEEKDDTRFWRFEESPCGDEPTAIASPSTDSRRSDPGNLQAKDFPAPMINLQNTPAAPDPTGLTNALALLSSANLFRDVTGLDANQKNALAALQTALQTAQSFGSQAASAYVQLKKQEQAAKDSGQTLSTINQGVNKGFLDKAMATTAVQDLLKSMTGGSTATDSASKTGANGNFSGIGSNVDWNRVIAADARTAEGDALSVKLAETTGEATSSSSESTSTPAVATSLPSRLDGFDAYVENGEFRWSQIVQAGFKFAIFKTSDAGFCGGGLTRFKFSHYRSGSMGAGLITGSYHFFRTRQPAADQAALMIGEIKRVGPGELGPSLDFEQDSNLATDDRCTSNPTNPRYQDTQEKLLNELVTFLETMETALGRTPLIYTSSSCWTGTIREHPTNTPATAAAIEYLGNCVLWIVRERSGQYSTRMTAQPTDATYPIPEPWSDWLFWQYAGHRPNVAELRQVFGNPDNSGADFDVFNGTVYRLRGLADLGRPAVYGCGGDARIVFTDTHGHLQLREQFAGEWYDTDLNDLTWEEDSMQIRLHPAADDPSACTLGSEEHVFFRSAINGHLYQLTRDTSATDPAWQIPFDVTQAVGGGSLVCGPHAFVANGKLCVSYWGDLSTEAGSAENRRFLLQQNGAWQLLDLSAAGLPPSSGAPVGYDLDGEVHVVGRAGADGHLWDSWLDPDSSPAPADLTVAAGGKAATYRPALYVEAGRTHIVYRAVRGHIHQFPRDLSLPDLDLCVLASAPTAWGNPAAFVDANGPHIVFRSKDFHLYELYRSGEMNWRYRDITTAAYDNNTVAATAPLAAADPVVCTADGASYVVFLDDQGGLYRLALSGTDWWWELITSSASNAE